MKIDEVEMKLARVKWLKRQIKNSVSSVESIDGWELNHIPSGAQLPVPPHLMKALIAKQHDEWQTELNSLKDELRITE